MTDARMHAFMDFVFAHFGMPLGAMDESRAKDLMATWQSACDFCTLPPKPRDGALVLDGQFFMQAKGN